MEIQCLQNIKRIEVARRRFLKNSCCYGCWLSTTTSIFPSRNGSREYTFEFVMRANVMQLLAVYMHGNEEDDRLDVCYKFYQREFTECKCLVDG